MLAEWVIGVLLCISGAGLTNFGLTLQKLNYMRMEEAARQSQYDYIQSLDQAINQSVDQFSDQSDDEENSYTVSIIESPGDQMFMNSNEYQSNLINHQTYNQSVEPNDQSYSIDPSINQTVNQIEQSPRPSSSPSPNPSINQSPSISDVHSSPNIQEKEEPPNQSSWRQPLWLLGLTIFLIGQSFGLLAMGFASQSLIAVLSSFSLVTNSILAPLMLHEPMTKSNIVSLIIILIGAVFVIFGSDRSSSQEYSIDRLIGLMYRPIFIVYASCLIVGLIICTWLMIREKMRYKKWLNKQSIYQSNNQTNNQTADQPLDNNSNDIYTSKSPLSSQKVNQSSNQSLATPLLSINTNDVFTDAQLTGRPIRLLVDPKSPDSSNNQFSIQSPGRLSDVQSINQSTDQSTDQSINQMKLSAAIPTLTAAILSSISVMLGKCTVQLIKLTYQSTKLSASQPVGQTMDPSINHSFILKDDEPTNQFVYPISWLITGIFIVSAVGSINQLNVGLKRGSALFVVPFYYVSSTLLAIIGGLIYFEEFVNLSINQGIMFLIGCTLTVLGVYVSTRGQVMENTDRLIDQMNEDRMVDQLIDEEEDELFEEYDEISLNHSINPAINQSINRSISQLETSRLLSKSQSVPETYGSFNQPINQSISPSVNRSVTQPVGTIDQSVSSSIDSSINQSINQPTNQFPPVHRVARTQSMVSLSSVNQPINQTINQPFNRLQRRSSAITAEQANHQLSHQSTNQSINQQVWTPHFTFAFYPIVPSTPHRPGQSNQSNNQSNNQSTNQFRRNVPRSQSVGVTPRSLRNQSFALSNNHSIVQTTNQSTNQSINQSINERLNQQSNHLINQSVLSPHSGKPYSRKSQ